jgi:hypothetical protein
MRLFGSRVVMFSTRNLGRMVLLLETIRNTYTQIERRASIVQNSASEKISIQRDLEHVSIFLRSIVAIVLCTRISQFKPIKYLPNNFPSCYPKKRKKKKSVYISLHNTMIIQCKSFPVTGSSVVGTVCRGGTSPAQRASGNSGSP